MTDRSTSLRTLLAAATIVAVGLAAYHNSFSGPFVFDDAPTIQDNGTIRHLWPVWDAFRPPHNGSTADGRPSPRSYRSGDDSAGSRRWRLLCFPRQS